MSISLLRSHHPAGVKANEVSKQISPTVGLPPYLILLLGYNDRMNVPQDLISVQGTEENPVTIDDNSLRAFLEDLVRNMNNMQNEFNTFRNQGGNQ